MVTAGLEEVELGPPGFLCKATDAWGRPDLLPAALGGTFAVSFLLSPESGAIAGTPATEGDLGAGATEAEGITGAHIAASIIVARFEAGEEFGAGRAGFGKSLGWQAEAEEQNSPRPTYAEPRPDASFHVLPQGENSPAATVALCGNCAERFGNSLARN